jgi:hypothetical protein
MSKNTLYHFGDSFSMSLGNGQNFGKKIADYYELGYLHLGVGGDSNDQIIEKIMKEQHQIKRGDVVLINFSFLSRFLTVDENGTLISSARYFDDSNRGFTGDQLEYFNHDDTVLDYFLNNNYEYNIRLFSLINTFLSILVERKITIYSVMIRKEDLYKGKKIYKIEDYDLKLFNELIFEPNYFEWLVNKGWKNEEEGHYTKGVQEELAQEYIKRINQFKIRKII